MACQQVDLQRTLSVLLADLGGHADVGGDHALDLMIVDQLRDAEELLTLDLRKNNMVIPCFFVQRVL